MMRDGRVVPSILDCMNYLPSINYVFQNKGDKIYSEVIEETEYYLSKLVPKEPKNDVFWHLCGICGQMVEKSDNYCRNCGQAIKWEHKI